eukprot:8711004-Lingulodinium_polyedra.AAC.1
MECARRAMCEPLRRTAITTAPLYSVLQTIRNDAVEIAVRRPGGSQIMMRLKLPPAVPAARAAH